MATTIVTLKLQPRVCVGASLDGPSIEQLIAEGYLIRPPQHHGPDLTGFIDGKLVEFDIAAMPTPEIVHTSPPCAHFAVGMQSIDHTTSDDEH